MLQIMGGDVDAAPYKWFLDLCVRAYLAVRPYVEQVLALVSLMLETGLPCFRTAKVLDALRARFAPDKSEPEAAAFIRTVIRNSTVNVRTNLYDKIQYYQNKIPY